MCWFAVGAESSRAERRILCGMCEYSEEAPQSLGSTLDGQ